MYIGSLVFLFVEFQRVGVRHDCNGMIDGPTLHKDQHHVVYEKMASYLDTAVAGKFDSVDQWHVRVLLSLLSCAYVSTLRHCTCCLLLVYLVNVVEYNSARIKVIRKCKCKREMYMYICVCGGASSKQTGLLLDELSVTAKETVITGYFYCCCWYDNDDLVSGHGNKSLPRQRRKRGKDCSYTGL